jgi:hypothetical protein
LPKDLIIMLETDTLYNINNKIIEKKFPFFLVYNKFFSSWYWRFSCNLRSDINIEILEVW